VSDTWSLAKIVRKVEFKLLQIKQQLRERMPDPVPRTGSWLKSIVQGYFNYHAVPGNVHSLGLFRERVLSLWWHTLCRRSQKRRLSWARMLQLAARWLPPPRVLHPYPAVRFAARYLR
jgi:RNA-directed DNA polymerase